MSKQGFTFIELMVVLGIVGVLMGITVSRLPQGDIELKQAAQSFAITVGKARSEAIRNNEFAGVLVTNNSSFSVYVDDGDRISNSGDSIISTVTLTEDYPSITIAKSITANNVVTFDPRGFVRGNTDPDIVFSSTKSNSTISAAINLQGRVSLTKSN